MSSPSTSMRAGLPVSGSAMRSAVRNWEEASPRTFTLSQSIFPGRIASGGKPGFARYSMRAPIPHGAPALARVNPFFARRARLGEKLLECGAVAGLEELADRVELLAVFAQLV